MSISLRHPITGEIKLQPEGWSWACFFGSGVLGLPLFRRGLCVWGAAMLVLDVTTFIAGWIATDSAETVYFWMSAIGLAASIFFGLKANELATNRALLNGWEFTDRRRDWFN